MRRVLVIVLLVVALVACAMGLAACGAQRAQKQMAAMRESAAVIKVKCTPLVINGDMIAAEFTVTFPPNYFYEDVLLRLTPQLISEAGVVDGEPKYLEGDFVKGDSQVISWRSGGSYTQQIEFPYSADMHEATLQLYPEIMATCYDSTLAFRQMSPSILLAKANF